MHLSRTKRIALSAAAALTAVTGVGGLAAAHADGTADPGRPAAIASNATKLVLRPDLTVGNQHLDNAGHLHVSVINQGKLKANGFRIAVLASAQSHSVYSLGLNPGASMDVDLSSLSCGQSAVILADMDHVITEGDEANNALAVTGPCVIDNGIHGVGVSE